jgi:plastocyanin
MWISHRRTSVCADASEAEMPHAWGVPHKESLMRIRTPLAMLALPAIALAFSGCGSSAAENAANAGPAVSKTQLASLVISHATVGCHNWSLNGGATKVSQTVSLVPGSALTVTDQDVMAHTVVQTAGPRAVIQHPLTNKTQAATLTFTQPGTYKFGTKAGEDYTSGITTTGPDHVLRLTVIVT